jgi:uncharacterized protein
MKKATLILGASSNPDRYAYKALVALQRQGHPIYLVGNKKVEVGGLTIEKDFPQSTTIDTITMYLSAKNQENYYDKIIQLKPKRVLFNPGAENVSFSNLLNKNGIETENACTLVLLSIGAY